MSDELLVTTDGAVRVVTINRPDDLNVVNATLHHKLLDVWRDLERDTGVRCVVLTGAGKTFSGGGDFAFLKAQHRSLGYRYGISAQAADILHAMINFRLPVVAAVNGPAVGLGCSLVALSDIVYIAEDAYLADPHVQVGLVAADGGPLPWPLHISLLLAKEYALTGARISATRAVELGLANHAVADPVAEALKAAKKILELPQQAVESTKRVLNVHLERAVLATIDYALSAENQSFQTEDFRSIAAKLAAGKN